MIIFRLLILPAVAAIMGACAETRKEPPASLEPEAGAMESPGMEYSGWIFPIENGSVPIDPKLLPNAVREYRAGVHEGIDIYLFSNGDSVPCNTPVLNSRAGWITRADHNWPLMNYKEYQSLIDLLNQGKEEGQEEALDRLRGRQVWVQTEDGTVLRYCHLNSITAHSKVGTKIAPGVVVGYVGNSGTISSVRGPWRNCHLHFEVWPSPERYLGKGRSPQEAGQLYRDLFKDH